ncbi:DUF3043 domain-containing protein [Nocardioides sp. CPCC 205120]|uniref:DUF3043 domain-containing protein n=1 Tax=Nocardioides sp. CPCC 205120 TaxID=3406462 RepID=UPI003B50E43A
MRPALFRRSSTPVDPGPSTTEAPDPTGEVDGRPSKNPAAKGRPTPSRREAEAAARARAKPARSRKELAAKERADRKARQDKVREAMKTGDETFMPKRDRGPVRRFTRDFVDSRFSFTELTLPVMVLSLVLQYSGNADLVAMGTLVLTTMLLLVVLDVLYLRFRLRREVRRRFPDEPFKGLTFYAVSRSLQIKPWRLPKPRVKIGARLGEDYR